MQKQYIISCFSVCLLLLVSSTGLNAQKKLAQLFIKKKLEGCIVISSLEGKKHYMYNSSRCHTRFIPASTFKIPHTLIALDENIVQKKNDRIKWDGQDRGWDVWNRDQTLQSAFTVSCIWVYQKFAAQLTREKYIYHLKKMEYGNMKNGPDITTFWLDGDIKISAVEQIKFLKKLYRNQLPYRKNHVNILKDIMRTEKTASYTLYAKTGLTTMKTAQHIGWYVGFIESGKKVWFFATNMVIKNKEHIKYRKEVTIEALSLLGII